jgi:prepilin-type N-terminal cleavage/methylation domain-containing protein
MRKAKQAGITLLEMSMVLMIVGVLLATLSRPMQGLILRKQQFEACHEIEQIRQALLDFAVVHGRLPWASKDHQGEESQKHELGLLAWRTLGLKPTTVWGEAYRYQVSAAWADTRHDPVRVGDCQVDEAMNLLSVNFCSQGTLPVWNEKRALLHDGAVAIVTQSHPLARQQGVCNPGQTWLAPETVLGRLVTAGRLY